MSSRTRFAVLDCEDAPRWRGHESIWVAAYGRPGEHWEHFRCWAGELPALSELASYQGLVVTGSHHDAFDESLEWLTQLCAFLRAAQQAGGVKMLGGCFGCQVLARALGGRVGRNPSGKFTVGSERLELTRALAQRRDFARARAICPLSETKAEAARFRGPGLHLLTAHMDCVLALPPGADLLAASPGAAVELWALGKDVLAQQCHPELSAHHIRDLVLPGLTARGSLSPDQAVLAVASMERVLDAKLMLAMGRSFLRDDAAGEHSLASRSQPRRTDAHALRLIAEDTAEQVSAALAASAAVRLGAGDSAEGVPSAAAPNDASPAAAAQMLFSSGAAALSGELALLNGEYSLLSALNDAAAGQYGHMADFTAGLGVFASALAAKDSAFTPFLATIDAIDAQVGELETVVSTLDGYTRRLEVRVAALQEQQPMR